MFHTRKLARYGLTAILLSTTPMAAWAQTDPLALLVKDLVKRGELSPADAQEIIAVSKSEHGAQPAQLAPAAPPPAPAVPQSAGTIVSTASTPAGTMHLTYVPKYVRDQIATQVQQQVVAQEHAQGNAAPFEVPDWVNRLHFYGDVRARYQMDNFPHGNDDSGDLINYDAINTGSPLDVSQAGLATTKPPSLNVNEDRAVFELRARLGVDADLGDGFATGFRIATGSSDSPVSENQVLGAAPSGTQGGGFSKYAIWLDRAYIAYQPDIDEDAKVKFEVGRFENPFFATNLIWADDLNFDGVAVQGSYDFENGVVPFLTLGAFPVYNTDFNFGSTNSAKFPSHDKWLYAVQAGTDYKIDDNFALKFGAAYYYFTNMEGQLSSPCTVLSASTSCDTDDDRPQFAQNGNTYMLLRNIVSTAANAEGTTTQYQYFGLASPFQELALTGRFDVTGLTPTDGWIIAEYVRNLAFNKNSVASRAFNNFGGVAADAPSGTVAPYEGGNQGFFITVSVGDKELKKRWDWNGFLGYKYLESDAVVDGLTDSDFGLGGTNLKGYIAGGDVALSPKVWVRLRYLSADEIVGPPYKSDVFQFDLNAKF